MVKTCDYLYMNKDVYFAKPWKMFILGSERKLRNQRRACFTILDDVFILTLLNMKPRIPIISTEYLRIYCIYICIRFFFFRMYQFNFFKIA